ncbi:MAG: sugar transporter permease [Eubacterium sp.]|nr:sugar transporter permease [Eubacterium sp.]
MKTSFFKKLMKYKLLLLMLLPAVLYFIVFNYLPMAGIIVAFKRFDYRGGIFGSPWIGFENFKFLFINGDIFRVAKNTVLYNAGFIIINNTLQIAVAIMLTELAGKYFKKITQTVMFLPYFISWVVVGAFVYNIFSYEYGFLNNLLKTLSIEPVNVYDKPVVWVFIIFFFSFWKSIGYGTVMYLAAIAGIDREMYEAADIDGCNIFQRILHITLPSLIPTVIILVLLSIGNIFRGDFSMFYQIVGQNSLVYSHTDVIDTFVTRSLMETREFGMTSAAGLIQSVLCFLIINLANLAVRKYDKGYALY